MIDAHSLVRRTPIGRSRAPSAWRYSAALAAIGFTWCWPAVAGAAHIELRPECRCGGAVVRLGDVAQVTAADAQQADALAAVELFPAPAPGTRRFLPVRDIQDLLLIRGVNLLEHRISGASQVVLLGAVEREETQESGALPAVVARRAAKRIREALVRYLQEHVSQTDPWTVETTLDNAHARLVAAAGSELSVGGGAPPWVGMQRFEVTVSGSGDVVRFDVDAEVALAPSVVVAARSLPRGMVIRAADVRLEPRPAGDGHAHGYQAIEEVVGKQTMRPIPEGKALERNAVRRPLLVRRGEVITVYARSAGIQVRSTAKARDDGSLGELVQVESLLDRATYFARVSGIQEVEVFAHATQAARQAAGRSPGVAAGAKPSAY